MLSLIKRKDTSTPAGAVDEAATVQAARTRARRRLIGAAVLVGIGIIGFPMLFETQPRPIAVDIPIEIPSRDHAPPLAMPAPPPLPAAQSAARSAGPSAPAEAPLEPAAQADAVASAPTPAAAPATLASAPAKPERAAVAQNSRETQRAQDLLDGKLSAAAPPTTAASEARAARFVVQAGAYTDAAALREARQRVEKLGLKTYTQVIETESGARTRVRVGPFATREEADQAAARIKGSGLAVSILSL